MRWLWLVFIGFLISCSNQHGGLPPQEGVKDINGISVSDDADAEVSADVEVEEDTYSIFTDPCIDCKWYFCPPLDSVWQKQICINNCEDPPTVVFESVCEEYLECDPSQYLLDVALPCQTEDGFPGTQDKVCNKGVIQYTDCKTQCVDEICDDIDNDCDDSVDEGFADITEICNNLDDNCNDIVDEGQWTCDNGCGAGPNLCIAGEFLCIAPLPEEEVCNGVDDDCDGEVDEGQLNACGGCGLEPEDICNGLDDDCDGETDEDLLAPCSTACGEGYEVCDGGNWVSCNAPPVYDEICDGFDNDCDGQIDEELQCVCTIQDVGALFPCQEPPLLCGSGYKTCECLDPECKTIVTTECFAICHWMAQPVGTDPTCDPLVGIELQQEKCNNFDDDCNQLIDENLFAACYTGPEGTVNVGICVPGEVMCEAGAWGHENENTGLFTPSYCKGEITPQPEICNGVDDDCDGVTDWGGELEDTDILFIVDWSGSMSDEQSAVLIALNQFAATFSDEQVLQWGLILGPRPDPTVTYGDDILELYHNLSGFTDFLNAMSSLSSTSMGGGAEMLLDAIYLSVGNISTALSTPIADLEWKDWNVTESIPHHDDFKIDWRPNTDRIIIVFTDEEQQSYLKDENDLPLSVPIVSMAVQNTPDLKLYVFSNNQNWQWDELAIAGNGSYYNLTNSPTEMYNGLMEILDEVCKSGGVDDG
jgi:hypothetical protein